MIVDLDVGVCCLLYVDCCVWRVVRCYLCVVCCLLCVVCCWLCVIVYWSCVVDCALNYRVARGIVLNTALIVVCCV